MYINEKLSSIVSDLNPVVSVALNNLVQTDDRAFSEHFLNKLNDIKELDSSPPNPVPAAKNYTLTDAYFEPSNYSLDEDQLLVDSEQEALSKRPNLLEFANASKLSHLEASELLYGVIGANADLRDWDKIMSADDVVAATKQATAQLYNSRKNYELVHHKDYGKINFDEVLQTHNIASKEILEQEGNILVIADENGNQRNVIASKSGLILRNLTGSTENLKSVAWLFGFDTKS